MNTNKQHEKLLALTIKKMNETLAHHNSDIQFKLGEDLILICAQNIINRYLITLDILFQGGQVDVETKNKKQEEFTGDDALANTYANIFMGFLEYLTQSIADEQKKTQFVQALESIQNFSDEFLTVFEHFFADVKGSIMLNAVVCGYKKEANRLSIIPDNMVTILEQ